MSPVRGSARERLARRLGRGVAAGVAAGAPRRSAPARLLVAAQIAAVLLSSGCGPGSRPTAPEGAPSGMTDQLSADLQRVRRSRFVFFHQSVGRDILAGIELLDRRAGGGRLEVRALEDVPARGGVLAHLSGGRNGDPAGKIDFFAGSLRRVAQLEPDAVFMKLCYADFTPTTDVDALFAHYQRTLEAARREHPAIRFAHVTVPLFVRPDGIRPALRRLLGMEVWEDAANAKRAEFNRRLVDAFGREPLLDLARVEAIGPDGSSRTFELRGRTIPSLHPAYTDDGGHLNAMGREVAGAAAIRFLAQAVGDR